MKLHFLHIAFCLLFSACKRDDIIVSKPNTPPHDKLVFGRELPLHPYDARATNSIVASNSQFIILNTDWNSGNKNYPGYFRTHSWLDEYFNELCKDEGFNYTGSFQASACEANGNVFFYSHSYYPTDFTATKFLNTDIIWSLKDCNLFGNILFKREDTLIKGTSTYFVDFFKITQKGTIVFLFKDSVYAMNTAGSVKWKIPYSSLNLSALRDVCETASGDILLLGEKQSVSTDRDFCITRFDKNGNMVWQKLYGGANYEEAQQILYKNDQEIFLLGHSTSYSSNGIHDAFIVHIISDGDTLKQKTFGGVYQNGLQCGKLYMDKLVVSGYRDPDGSGREQVFAALLDKDLNVLQQTDAPFTFNHRPTSCALINTTFAVCGDGFVIRFTLPY